MMKCIWHPKRRALVCGMLSHCGYCRECWGKPSQLMCGRSVVGADAALWLAS